MRIEIRVAGGKCESATASLVPPPPSCLSAIREWSLLHHTVPMLFLKLTLFLRIGGALEVDAITVGIGERYYPQTVSDKWTLPRLYSA